MDMFLSNDATFPIFRYQQESILDKNVLYSKWKKRSEIYPPSFDRDISFVHPLNNSVGPTQAKTNRQQSFKRFGTLGATLENVTIVNGVPGADCFRVEDRWSIESLSESSVQLTVTFQIVFSKRTMFKPIIQKNVKIETKKWFQGYAKFLRHALHEDDKKDGVPLLSLDSDMEPLVGMEQAHAVSGLHSPTVAIAVGLFLVFSVLLLQLFFLQKSVFVLQDELVLMRAEQQVLASMLNSMTNSKKC